MGKALFLKKVIPSAEEVEGVDPLMVRTGLQAEELSMIQTFHKVFSAPRRSKSRMRKFGKPCR